MEDRDGDGDYVEEEEEYEEHQPRKKQKSQSKSRPRETARESIASLGSSRIRPTNNQLLYKAHFRWEHDKLKIQDTSSLITETQACASVTSCFLEVLSTLHEAEQMRADGLPRNVLLELSEMTRKTKVVELSSGTHRVAEELKKHCLTDGVGGQYSTNLDRNRYGNDDNYLFTVIRFNLDFLGLCPCLVDVEIIDAKAEAAGRNHQTIVDAGQQSCTCKMGIVKSFSKPNAPDLDVLGQKRSGARHSKASASALPRFSPSFLMNGILLPPPSPNGSGSSLDALVLAAHQGMGADEGLVVTAGNNNFLSGLMRSEFPNSNPGGPMMAAPNVMSHQGLKESAPMISGGLGIGGLMTGFAGGASAFTRPTPLTNQKEVFGGLSPLDDQLRLSGGGMVVLGAANGSTNGGGSSDAGAREQNQAKGNASRLRRALSTGLFETLETGLELFRKSEMDDIASFPQGSSDGALNSLLGTLLPTYSGGSQRLFNDVNPIFKPVDVKTEVSASLLLCADSGGAGNAFGVPSVNSGDEQGGGGGVNQGGAVSKRAATNGECDKAKEGQEDDTTGENEEGETEEDSSQRRKRHVSKQNSVANLSNRVSSADMKRLTAEVESLRAENGSLLERCLSAEQREQALCEQLSFLSSMMNQSNLAVSQILLAQQLQQQAQAQAQAGPNPDDANAGVASTPEDKN